MTTPSIEVIETRLFPGVVADELVASIGEAVSENGTCSIVLSGGKTPSSTYRELSHPPRVDDVDWKRVKMFWGDERYVTSDNVHSNFKMVDDTLLDHVPEPKPEVYQINTNLSTPDEVAEHYEQTVRDAMGLAEKEMPVFDIVLLGIGGDGHTASLFPGSNLISKTGWLAAGVTENCGEYPRITLSPEVLFGARKIYFLVRGEDKSEIMNQIIDGGKSASELPAMLYQQAADRVTWFVDSAAGNKMKQN